MCGRARCTLQREQIAELAGVNPDTFVNGEKYRPCENMGPGRYGPVTFRARDSRHGTGSKKDWEKTKKLQAMQWGLIPSFTKPHAKPDHFMMFNARSESLHERPAFRRLLETKRCIVFSDGYYEWQQVDKREKQPHYVYRATGPLKFAGLYDTWQDEQGDQRYTYTILTTESSPEMSWMHTRMPVILNDDGVSQWLSDAKFDSLRDLLVAYRGEDLKWHPVDRKVGSTKFQSEDCSKKIDIKHAANITSFFGSNPSPVKDTTKPTQTKAIGSGGSHTIHPITEQSHLCVPSQGDSVKTSQAESVTNSQDEVISSSFADDSKQVAAKAPSVTILPFKAQRKEAFRSPIKFLFQQQHMVQQAEDILIASKVTGAPVSDSLASSASDSKSAALLKKAHPHPAFVPASALHRPEMGTKRSAASSPNNPSASPKRLKKTQQSPKQRPSKNPQRGTLLAFFQPKS